jgi:hypothetical protein
MLQCKVGALGIIYVEDHHSRNRQLLDRSNKVVALQSSSINLQARKQLSVITMLKYNLSKLLQSKPKSFKIF